MDHSLPTLVENIVSLRDQDNFFFLQHEFKTFPPNSCKTRIQTSAYLNTRRCDIINKDSVQ